MYNRREMIQLCKGIDFFSSHACKSFFLNKKLPRLRIISKKAWKVLIEAANEWEELRDFFKL